MTVQLNTKVVDELWRYLKSLGQAASSHDYPVIPLTTALPYSEPLGSADEPVSDSHLYRVVNDFLRCTAASVIKLNCMLSRGFETHGGTDQAIPFQRTEFTME